ncbi:MAG TPA: VCBS repeat-containing protein [Candidatus Solibacter sp.]|nr:VCBS repeat-containing protein [Candidatus Solibacter sp.]
MLRNIRWPAAIPVLLSTLSLPALGATLEFTSATVYSVPPGPGSVVVGDFNGDDKLDVAVASQGSVSILLGKGNGTFQPAKSFSDGGSGSSLATGDFNRDGKLDLLVFIGNSAALCLGNGDGTFQAPVPIPGATSTSLIVSDVNLDNRPDFVSGSYLFLGNGDGTFQAPRDLGASVLLIADLNADKKPDLVVSSLRIMLGNGDGTFDPPVTVSLVATAPDLGCLFCKTGYSNVVTGDFNGDGRPDLAIGRITTECIDRCNVTATAILTFLGNGDGTFQPGPSFDTDASVLPVFLIAGDFNGDGKADIAASSTILYGSSVIQFYLGQGDGTFPTIADYEVGTGFVDLVIADFNGDKLPDIVSADPNDANISVVLSIAPDFSLAATSTNLSVARGGEASEALSVETQSGFSAAVGLTCSVTGPAPILNCSVSPTSVNPGSMATLTVSTSSAAASMFPGLPYYGLFATVLVSGFLSRRCLKGGRRVSLGGSLILGVAVFFVACGGGSKQPSTQSYTVTVTGTSSELVHSTNIAVTVE